jgi:hypothetical protein
LQPHYIASFFVAALEQLGGSIHERENNRYEVTHTPAAVRQAGPAVGKGEPLLPRYERICFDKKLRNLAGKPVATFIHPGHPLLDGVISVVLERYRPLLKQGAVLVDDRDLGERLRALIFLEHSVRDARPASDGRRREISRRLQFVELELQADGPAGEPVCRNAGFAPYLDYRPLRADERALLQPIVQQTLATQDLERAAMHYAVQQLAPAHLREVRAAREPLIDKIHAAVKERLTKEITYWDNQAIRLQEQERLGRGSARLNSANARQRRDALTERLAKRLAELDLERTMSVAAPLVTGAALVVPAGLIDRLQGAQPDELTEMELRLKYVEMAAMHAVMAGERRHGLNPTPVYRFESYDILSQGPNPEAGLRMIEVKGFTEGSTDITLTRNEMIHALNRRESWLLALVKTPRQGAVSGHALQRMVDAGAVDEATAAACQVRYVPLWFSHEPNFGSTGENFDIQTLWAQGAPFLATAG